MSTKAGTIGVSGLPRRFTLWTMAVSVLAAAALFMSALALTLAGSGDRSVTSVARDRAPAERVGAEANAGALPSCVGCDQGTLSRGLLGRFIRHVPCPLVSGATKEPFSRVFLERFLGHVPCRPVSGATKRPSSGCSRPRRPLSLTISAVVRFSLDDRRSQVPPPIVGCALTYAGRCRPPARRSDLEELEDARKGRRVAAPVLRDHISPRRTQHVAEDQRRHDGIIQGAEHRDELRDQVDGRGHPRRAKDQEHLGSSRHPRIADQPFEQQEQVRQQCCHLPGGCPASREVQHADGHEVDGRSHSESDQERSHLTLRPPSSFARPAPTG